MSGQQSSRKSRSWGGPSGSAAYKCALQHTSCAPMKQLPRAAEPMPRALTTLCSSAMITCRFNLPGNWLAKICARFKLADIVLSKPNGLRNHAVETHDSMLDGVVDHVNPAEDTVNNHPKN